MRMVTAFLHLHITEVAAGRDIVAVSVGPEQDPIVLCQHLADDRQTYHQRSNAPRQYPGNPNRYKVAHQTDWGVISALLPETEATFDFVQPIGSDRLLLVDSRAESESEHNAHIYTTEEERVGSFHAGDGIQDVQTDAERNIWVSYFDEGVFGDLELGRHGVVAFDERGRPLLKFNQIPGPSSSIADCYAVNVAPNGEVWLYYYTDFPLVRLRQGRFDREWTDLPVRGSTAFAARGDTALFAGSYEYMDRLFLVSLRSMKVEELQPVDASGRPITFHHAIGRGDRLYLVSEEALYAMDIDDL